MKCQFHIRLQDIFPGGGGAVSFPTVEVRNLAYKLRYKPFKTIFTAGPGVVRTEIYNKDTNLIFGINI
jgi:hypothetical protein